MRIVMVSLMCAWVMTFTSVLIAGCAPTAETESAVSGSTGVTDGVRVYLGVVPAEIVRGHPQKHEERKMHGGNRIVSNERHVLIALFDATTGVRIEDAEVRAQVGELGLSEELEPLEPMKIAGTITYGNYFGMPKPGPYVIEVEWRKKGSVNWSHIVFSYPLRQ